MPKLKFYDVKGKKKFVTDKYRLTALNSKKKFSKRKTYFAVANAPSGIKAWRIVSKDFYMENK